MNPIFFNSPTHKIINFLQKGRDKWREKAKTRSKTIKLLKKRIKFLESSKSQLKDQAKELKTELSKVKRANHDKEALKEIRVPVQSNCDDGDGGNNDEENESKRIATPLANNLSLTTEGIKNTVEPNLPNHHYTATTMLLNISMILASYTSMRSTPSAIDMVLSFFNLTSPMPSWSTARLWLMRVGYYLLMQPKDNADDWIWIIDHSVQSGPEKCLVILGVRLSHLSAKNKTLKHKDTQVIELLPVKKSNGDIVYGQLEEAAKKTGIPREIVGDYGPDIKCGIEKFCSEHTETVYIHDIKHRCALLLERELADDEVWKAFRTLASHTKKCLQQTELSSLAPPNQRTKARYMNVDTLIAWIARILWLFDNPDEIERANIKMETLKEKLGWVNDYRKVVTQEWFPMMDAISRTEDFVRRNGLFNGAHHELTKLLSGQNYPERASGLSNQLVEFVRNESWKAKPNETLIGSSELIESLYGKEKELEGAQSKSGFTGLILSIPAMVSTITRSTVEQAMKTVPVEKIREWYKENIGASIQSKRRSTFKNYKKEEQIWDQELEPC